MEDRMDAALIFADEEYEIIAAALDMMVRAEAQALAQGGIAALAGGKAAMLSERLVKATAIYERVKARPKTEGG